jgi:hypothetical protein
MGRKKKNSEPQGEETASQPGITADEKEKEPEKKSEPESFESKENVPGKFRKFQ